MSKINEKMIELKEKISEFENYIKEFKQTKYDYHCELGIERLYHELSQLKVWLEASYK